MDFSFLRTSKDLPNQIHSMKSPWLKGDKILKEVSHSHVGDTVSGSGQRGLSLAMAIANKSNTNFKTAINLRQLVEERMRSKSEEYTTWCSSTNVHTSFDSFYPMIISRSIIHTNNTNSNTSTQACTQIMANDTKFQLILDGY